MGDAEDGDGGVEFLDVGLPGDDHGPRPRGPARRAWWLAAAALVAAGAVALLAHHRTPADHVARSSATSSRAPSQPAPGGAVAAPRPRVVTHLGHPILPGADGWQLFTLSADDVGRLDPRDGQLITTPLPALRSSGPVSFVAVAGEALVRPIDLVPGYVVPDGAASRPMPQRLAAGGPILPGPDPQHVWVQSGAGMALTGLDGRRTGERIERIPAGGSVLGAGADGRGYLLVPAAKGVYDVRPDGAHLVTTGSLVAYGPGPWLARECRAGRRCTLVSIDASGHRRAMSVAAPAGAPYGAVSPTGRFAALFTVGRAGHLSLSVLDLVRGATHPVTTSVAQSPDGALAWSPDGRWLLMVDSAGHVDAVMPGTGRAARLPGLSAVSQLVVRADPCCRRALR